MPSIWLLGKTQKGTPIYFCRHVQGLLSEKERAVVLDHCLREVALLPLEELLGVPRYVFHFTIQGIVFPCVYCHYPEGHPYVEIDNGKCSFSRTVTPFPDHRECWDINKLAHEVCASLREEYATPPAPLR